ncbi:hypothetical protein BJX65DRAFT_53009 [Aspergillus insuetus]
MMPRNRVTVAPGKDPVRKADIPPQVNRERLRFRSRIWVETSVNSRGAQLWVKQNTVPDRLGEGMTLIGSGERRNGAMNHRARSCAVCPVTASVSWETEKSEASVAERCKNGRTAPLSTRFDICGPRSTNDCKARSAASLAIGCQDVARSAMWRLPGFASEFFTDTAYSSRCSGIRLASLFAFSNLHLVGTTRVFFLGRTCIMLLTVSGFECRCRSEVDDFPPNMIKHPHGLGRAQQSTMQ